MIVNSNALATNSNIQSQQIMQSKTHDPQANGNVVMRIIKESDSVVDESKLPPWKKNSMQNQKQHQISSGGIPIFQINGQMIAVDQQGNGQQQYQIIEQKVDGEQKTIIRRRPTFKEDPTGYLNQQTALLQNTITTLHSPVDGTTVTSNSPIENSTELRTQRQQFIQQIMKPGNNQQQVTIGGQTVTHMSNGIVQIQNCDIKQPQGKALMIQEQQQQQQQLMQQNKYIRTNPKGRPPKNAATIAKRLVAMSQESPVSSSTSSTSIGSPLGGNVMKITKANTPDITSSSSHADLETMQVQSSSFDATEIVKFARNSTTTQELIRTSMTQMMAGKTTATTTAIRKQPQMMMATKKPQMMTQVKSQPNTTTVSGNQQVVMTSNGQQYIVMPSANMQQHNTQAMLNNNAIVQFQNSAPKILQSHHHQNAGNIIFQTNAGGNFIVNQPSIMLQNGQIITTGNNLNNLIASPKGNIFSMTGGGQCAVSTSGTGTTTKTIISGNNQLSSPLMGQQTMILPNNTVMPQSTIIHDPSSFMTSSATIQQHQQQQHQQQKIIVQHPSNSNVTATVEKKKGRKRKIPLAEASMQPVTISHHHVQQQQQQQQQPNMIQMAPQQSFQLSPNFLVNKFPTQQGGTYHFPFSYDVLLKYLITYSEHVY